LHASKLTLLMFRRNEGKQRNLELRHQRTCDALFDLVDDDLGPYSKTKEYVYRLIETLLPKALYDPEVPGLRMMELWGEDLPREGWISVCQETN